MYRLISPYLSIHVTPCTPPGRTIERWGHIDGDSGTICVCYGNRTGMLFSVARNALGLTGFGSFSTQSCPDMIGLCWAEGSSGPPRKKRGLCPKTQPMYGFKKSRQVRKNTEQILPGNLKRTNMDREDIENDFFVFFVWGGL